MYVKLFEEFINTPKIGIFSDKEASEILRNLIYPKYRDYEDQTEAYYKYIDKFKYFDGFNRYGHEFKYILVYDSSEIYAIIRFKTNYQDIKDLVGMWFVSVNSDFKGGGYSKLAIEELFKYCSIKKYRLDPSYFVEDGLKYIRKYFSIYSKQYNVPVIFTHKLIEYQDSIDTKKFKRLSTDEYIYKGYHVIITDYIYDLNRFDPDKKYIVIFISRHDRLKPEFPKNVIHFEWFCDVYSLEYRELDEYLDRIIKKDNINESVDIIKNTVIKKIKTFKTDEGKFSIYDFSSDVRGRANIFTVFEDKNGWIVRNAFVPIELQRKGMATDFYISTNKLSKAETGKPLKSTQPRKLSTGEIVHELSKAGIALWDSFVDKGLAIKIGYKDYRFK